MEETAFPRIDKNTIWADHALGDADSSHYNEERTPKREGEIGADRVGSVCLLCYENRKNNESAANAAADDHVYHRGPRLRHCVRIDRSLLEPA